MSRDAERVRRIVCGVLDAALRDTGTDGVVVAAPPSGPSELFREWTVEAGMAAASADEVTKVVREIGLDPPADPEIHRAAARILARRRNLLPVHPIHKTALLLGGAPPPEPLLPLADLFASELARWCEGVPRPTLLEGRDEETVRRVDRALEGYLEGRTPWDEAAAGLSDELADAVAGALARGRWYRLWSPVTPKLGHRTPGIDLDL